LPAIWGLPTVRFTIGVSSKLRKVSKPFPAAVIRRRKSRKSGVSAREVEILRQERDILKKALGIFSRSQL
jgi:hypothetical protein